MNLTKEHLDDEVRWMFWLIAALGVGGLVGAALALLMYWTGAVP